MVRSRRSAPTLGGFAISYLKMRANAMKIIALPCICAALFLASCQTTGGSFCDLAKPIRLTPEQVDALTDDQVRQYLGHNERGRKQCGWRQ